MPAGTLLCFSMQTGRSRDQTGGEEPKMKRREKSRNKRRKNQVGKKLSRRRLLLICCGVLVIAAAVITGVWSLRPGKEQPASGKTAAQDIHADPAAEDGRTGEEQDQTEGTAEAGESSGDDRDQDSSGQNNKSQGSGKQGDGPENSGGSEAVLQEGVRGITLPYQIPGSSLVVSGIASYDGIYLEDGSDTEISGVTVLLLRNDGDTDIEYASVSVGMDGTELQFDLSDLPAGGTAVVQEKNKTLFREGNYTECAATVAEVPGFEMSEEQVQVQENGDQSLTVSNLTNEDIPAVRIFYKFYMEEEETYVGGITYTAKLTDLKAGESRKITPSHYVSGYSRVMMVRTYDTAE